MATTTRKRKLSSSLTDEVADEEGTIEEQEMMEGNADHKSELADLTKDGNDLLYFSDVCVDSWYLRSLTSLWTVLLSYCSKFGCFWSNSGGKRFLDTSCICDTNY